MKKTISIILAISLFIVTIAAPSCPGGGSNSVKAARSFAIAPIALDATSSIVEILTISGDIAEGDAQFAYRAIGTALDLLNDNQADIQTGKYDQAALDVKINAALAQIDALLASGKIGVKNPQSAQRLRTYLLLSRVTIQQLGNFLRKAKVEAVDTKAATADKGKEKIPALTADALSQIIFVAGEAGTNIAILVGTNDAIVLWKNAEESLAAAISNNKERIK